MISKTQLIAVFVFLLWRGYAQTCENYNRSLFHLLPKDFPNEINCKDLSGKKQGWWIYYKVQHNPVNKPDELGKGDYVEEYEYGQYKNSLKVGTWITVFNVHLISEIKNETFCYTKDTVSVFCEFAKGGWNKSTVYYIKDSSVIKSYSLPAGSKYNICIECDKGKQCSMTYRNKVIKYFSIDRFDEEFEKSFFIYERERMEIDDNYK